MIPLIDIATLKSRLGITMDIAGIDTLLTSAILSSQLRIAGHLDTSLDRIEDHTDVFYLDSSLSCGVIPNGVFLLRLKQAFVSGITSIKIGDTMDTITTEIDNTKVFLPPDKLVRGYIHVDKYYEGQYVSVEYDAGFDVNHTDAPPWLVEAITSYARTVVDMADKSAPQSGSASKAGQFIASHPPNVEHSLAVLAPYHRRLGFAMQPVY